MEVLKEEMKKIKEKIEKDKENNHFNREKVEDDENKVNAFPIISNILNSTGANSVVSSLAIAKQYEQLQMQLKVSSLYSIYNIFSNRKKKKRVVHYKNRWTMKK
jgi:hypothetical protein